MSKRFDQLSVHHSNLLMRTAAQRQQLAESAEEIEHELGRLDRGIAIVRRVLRSPALIGGAIAVVALVGPRRLMRWGTRGLMFYSTARHLLSHSRASGKPLRKKIDSRLRGNDELRNEELGDGEPAMPIRRESASAIPRHGDG